MKRLLIYIFLFIISITLFSQEVKQDLPTYKYSIKSDLLRAFLKQPSIIVEYYCNKKIALQLGASYFWTGQRIYWGENTGYTNDNAFAFVSGTGRSRGYSLLAEAKYIIHPERKIRLYAGLGYTFRYSHFEDELLVYKEGANNSERIYSVQTEKATTNGVRIEFGLLFNKYKLNNHIYFNPYIAISPAISKVDVVITELQNFHNHPIANSGFSATENRNPVFFEIGFNIGFGWK